MRVTYQSAAGQTVNGTLRAGSFALALDAGDTVLTCDAEGRPWTLWRRDRTWRRGYSGRVIEVWKGPDAIRRYRDVPATEWAESWEALRPRLADDAERTRRDLPALAELLERAWGADTAALEADAQRYRELYGAIGILPPDAYLSTVFQPVIGCPYNRCTFCDFYRDVDFQVRGGAVFADHVDAVIAYLGRALPMRRGVFLADADALAMSDDTFLGTLQTVRARLPNQPISAFTTPFLGGRRSLETYRAAASLGLHRLHLGVESGSADVLRLLGKPARTDRTAALVERAKAGGLSLGIIMMVGAGGEDLAESHLRDSVALVRALPLERDDIVYLSPLVLDGRSRYTDAADAIGTRPLDGEALQRQQTAFTRALRRPHGPRVARYDIRGFLD